MPKKPPKPNEQKQTEQAPQRQQDSDQGRGHTAADIIPTGFDLERGPTFADISHIEFDRVIPPVNRK